jgi:glyoxylate/hydroxypyruvate reductase A
MTFLFLCDAVRGAVFAKTFSKLVPKVSFAMAADEVDPEDVRFIMTWNPPLDLHRYTNLQAVFCIGAGVDQFAGTVMPAGVKLVRMVDDGITRMVAEYVAMAVLALHRNLHHYIDHQRRQCWREITPQVQAGERRISLMGTGVLGQAALEKLKTFGFYLAGWNRSHRSIDGVRCYTGADGLYEMLALTDILVCLLPLNASTAGILNGDVFSALPDGACLVHAGRGRQLDADALLSSLDSGQLSGAFLDVTDPEPLPSDHRLWAHPRVVITPHVAAITQADSAALTTVNNIKQLLSGRDPIGIVDPSELSVSAFPTSPRTHKGDLT